MAAASPLTEKGDEEVLVVVKPEPSASSPSTQERDDERKKSFKESFKAWDDDLNYEDENTCNYCNQSPCVLESFEDANNDMWSVPLRVTLGELVDKVEQECTKKARKQNNRLTRFLLYRHATKFIHGPLPKGERRKLPPCVMKHIMEAYPDPNGEYTGFKEAKK